MNFDKRSFGLALLWFAARLLRPRCYQPGHGKTSCATEAGSKTRHIELRESVLPCKIIDLSDTGAGLALSGANHVPHFFTLLIPDRAPVFCQSVWRQQERMGVSFRKLRVL